MADIQSNININVDTTAALANLKSLQREISAFQRSMAQSTAANAASAKNLQRNLLSSINASGQFAASITNVKTSADAFTTALEKNKLSLGEYFRYAGASSKTFGKLFTNEFNTIEKVARERVKTLATQYIKLGREANGAMSAISVRPLMMDMDSLATKTAIAAQKQQIFNQLLKQGSTNLLNFGKNTQWAGRQLMVGFTVPLTMLGTAAAKTFMAMEEQAIKFKRVYGDAFTSTKETNDMLNQLKELSSEFTKYGVAVEKTMEMAANAAAAGKMGADLLAQVNEATRLAVLGNVEQAQALETTISVTNAFGVASDKLAGKIDFLNAVENQTVTSIEDLTIAIPKAGPVIQQLGGDVEDLAFLLTAMKEGGINASEGANALKSGLASMINPTEKASKFLAGFGINLKGIVEVNKGDVKSTVVDFAKALDTLDPLNRARAIEQLFGKFQFARISTLFKNVIAEGSQASRVLQMTNASTAELAILSEREMKRIEDSPMFKFKKAFEDLKVSIAPVGEAFLKAVTPFIEFGTGLLKKFDELDGGAKSFVIGLTTLLGAIGPIAVMSFGLLANGVAQIIKGFAAVRAVFQRAGASSTTLGQQTDYMTQQQLEAAAVASSLDQTHNKLIQTFSVEKGALDRLTIAYRSAISEQAKFGVAPIATNIGKGKKPAKYASGVVSVPGPKGAGDIVPAMLAPGEAVIPADMVTRYSGLIQGMVAGNIPGFEKGRYDFGHLGSGKQLSVADVLKMPGITQRQSVKNPLEALFGIDPNALVNLKNAYGVSMDKSVNVKLGNKTGASIDEAAAQFTGSDIGRRYREMTKLTGDDINDPQTAKEFENYDKAMSARIKELKASGIKSIVDTEKQLLELPESQRKFTKSLESIDSDVVERIGKDNKRFAASRSKALRTVRDVRIGEGLTAQQKEKIMASPDASRYLTRAVSSRGDQRRVWISRQNKSQGGFAEMGFEGGRQSANAFQKGQASVLRSEAADPVMLQRSKKRNSPHPQAAIDGRDDARARIAAQTAEERKAAGIAKTYGGNFSPELRQERKRQQQIQKQSQAMAAKARKEAAVANGLAIKQQIDAENRLREANQKRQSRRNIAARLMPSRGAIAGGAMGIGSIAMGASMIGGPVGDVANKVMGPIMAISGIASAMSMLPGPIGIVVAGLGALGYAVYAFSDNIEKAKKAGIELANSMSMTSEKLEKLGALTGKVSATESRAKSNQLLLSGLTKKQMSEGEKLASSEFGMSLLADLQNQKKAGRSGAQIGNNLGLQLATAITQGVITSDQAKSLAAALSDKMKDHSIQIGVEGKLLSILGFNDEDLKNNPLQVRLQIQEQSMKETLSGFETALSNMQPTVTPGGTALMTLGAAAATAGGAMAATGVAAIPGAIVAGVGAGAMGVALVQQNIAMAENNKLRAAATQLAVQQVAANQGALDSLSREYDLKIQNAKTDKEIIQLQKEKAEAIKQLNAQNAGQLQQLKTAASSMTATDFGAAINASVDTLYKDADSATKTFVGQTKKDLGELANSDFKTNLQIGFASGLMDWSTVNALLSAAEEDKALEADINLSINTIGMDKTGLLTNVVKNLGGTTSTLKTNFSFVNENPEEIDSVINGITYLQTIKGVGINVDINATSPERLNKIGNAMAELQSYPDKITKTQLQELKAKDPKTFAAIYNSWADIVGSDDVITKNLILQITTVGGDLGLVNQWANATGRQSLLRRMDSDDLVKNYLDEASAWMEEKNKTQEESTKDFGKYDGGGSGGGTAPENLIAQTNKETSLSRMSKTFSKRGYNTEFVDMLASASEETRRQYVNAKGNLTKLGQALRAAYDKKILQEFTTSQQRLVKGMKAEEVAKTQLIASGLDYVTAVEAATRADVQAAIAAALAIKNAKLRKKALDEIAEALRTVSKQEKANVWAKQKTEQKLSKNDAINQVNAFNKLVGAGMDVARAYELIEDTALAASIAQTASTEEINNYVKAAEELAAIQQRARNPLEVEIENANAQIDVYSANQTMYQDALSLLQIEEEKINEKYNQRIEALDSIQEANERILEQQRGQLDLADAISRGDIAAAAKSAQEIRAKAVADSVDTQRKALAEGRDAQVNALTVLVSGQSLTMKELSNKITELEQKALQVKVDTVDPAAASLAQQNLDAVIPVADSNNASLNLENVDSGSTESTTPDPVVKPTKASTNWEAINYLKDTGSPVYTKIMADIATVDKYTKILNSPTATAAMKASSTRKIAAATATKNTAIAATKAGKYAMGGIVKPRYFNFGGFVPSGTDTVPAMLTPGEFVIRKSVVKSVGENNLSAINKTGTSLGNSVYNYDIQINVKSESNADQIANTVLTQIKRIDSQRLKGNRLNAN